MSSASGFRTSPSASDVTTGIAPPNPSTSCAVCPARVESITATTCSGVYRMQAFAVFDRRGLNAPSARIRKREFIEVLCGALGGRVFGDGDDVDGWTVRHEDATTWSREPQNERP